MKRMKRMKLDQGVIAVFLGAALMVSALVLLLYNIKQDNRASDSSRRALAHVYGVISENQAAGGSPVLSVEREKHDSGPASGLPVIYEPKAETAAEMPVRKIDGSAYIGCLHIPGLDLELPIMSSRDQESLNIAPCRHFGSSRTDDLVIAGHNYQSHFGKIHTLEPGDLIVFTDLLGVSSSFSVEVVAVVAPAAVAQIKDSGWDLTLYTCTYGGQQRLIVGCKATA